MRTGRCKLCNRYLNSPTAEHGPVCAKKESSSTLKELDKSQEISYRDDIDFSSYDFRGSIRDQEVFAKNLERFEKNGGGLIWSILNTEYNGEKKGVSPINSFMALKHYQLMNGIYTQTGEEKFLKKELSQLYKFNIEKTIDVFEELAEEQK